MMNGMTPELKMLEMAQMTFAWANGMNVRWPDEGEWYFKKYGRRKRSKYKTKSK